ncbi:MAG: hypothetical protein ACFE0I_06425 [Elainellaceae cyanobacterium]
MKRRNSEPSTLTPLLAGGLMFALVGLLIDVGGITPQNQSISHYTDCQGEVKEEVALSREQLAHVLTIPERDSKAKVQEILAAPYCQLPSIEIRAGVAAEREAYPLAFEPQTWLVILYEDDEYAGFRFSFQ